MNPAADNLYAVAKVVKAFGVSGEVVVQLMTDLPARMRRLKRVLLGTDPARVRGATVERVHVERRGVRVKFLEIGTRTAAEALVGTVLFVKAEDRVRIPRGTFFVHDVIGLTVVDEQGSPIGTVKEVLKLPAHDVYVIQRQGPDVLLPAVREFVRGIDMKSRTMTVRLIEGMLEEA